VVALRAVRVREIADLVRLACRQKVSHAN
jgi:hypothetical protein